MTAAYVDHVAVKVRDFDRIKQFFIEVMGADVTLTDPADGTEPLKQAWVGGVQLQRDESYDAAAQGEGRMTHIGMAVDDVDAVLERAYAVEGVVQAEGHERNWFVIPDGPMIEVVGR